jgi:hypothetical protein
MLSGGELTGGERPDYVILAELISSSCFLSLATTLPRNLNAQIQMLGQVARTWHATTFKWQQHPTI